MALVREMVVRFRAESADLAAKSEAAKAKLREVAQEMIRTAGSAEKAMATMKAAVQSGELVSFGIDPRSASGVLSQIKAIQKEARKGINDNNSNWLGGLKTAGTIGLIQRIGGELLNLTNIAKELKKQYQAGEISAGEMTEKLAAAVPVYGKIWESGRNIREILFGETNGTWWDAARAAEAIAKSFEGQVAAIIRANGEMLIQKKITDSLRQKNDADAMAAGGQPYQANEKRINDSAKEESAKITSEFSEKLKDSLAKFNAGTKELRRESTAADKKYADFIEKWEGVAPSKSAIEEGNLLRETSERLARQLSSLPKAREKLEEKVEKERDDRLAEIERRRVADQGKNTHTPQNTVQSIASFWGLGPKKKTAAQLDAEAMARDVAQSLGGMFDSVFGEAATVIASWHKRMKSKTKKMKEEAEKKAKDEKNEADSFRNSLLSPQEVLEKQVARAMSNPQIQKNDIDKFLTRQAVDLMDERKGLRAETPVYSLPAVAHYRAGTGLFVPPNKVDEKSLERLEQIRVLLATIKDQAKTAGVTIEELSI